MRRLPSVRRNRRPVVLVFEQIRLVLDPLESLIAPGDHVFVNLAARLFQNLLGRGEVRGAQGALQVVIDRQAFALIPLMNLRNCTPDGSVDGVAYHSAESHFACLDDTREEGCSGEIADGVHSASEFRLVRSIVRSQPIKIIRNSVPACSYKPLVPPRNVFSRRVCYLPVVRTTVFMWR